MLLLASLAPAAAAQDFDLQAYSDNLFCQLIWDTAHHTMVMRHMGLDLPGALASLDGETDPRRAELKREMVLAAFRVPQARTEDGLDRLADDFSDYWQAECYAIIPRWSCRSAAPGLDEGQRRVLTCPCSCSPEVHMFFCLPASLPPCLPAACALTAMAVPALAEPLSSGLYALTADGARGSVGVVGEVASIRVGGPGCLGGVSGIVQEAGPGQWFMEVPIGGEGACAIDLSSSPDGLLIQELGGCTPYHGASCSFSGAATFVGGSSDPEAMRQAFESFEPSERAALQSALTQDGLYSGALDGAYGPATAAALAQLP